MTQHQRRIFDIVRKGDVPELARSFPMKTVLTGIVLGIVFSIALIFGNRGICIRYAARLRVHDLEAWAIHLR